MGAHQLHQGGFAGAQLAGYVEDATIGGKPFGKSVARGAMLHVFDQRVIIVADDRIVEYPFERLPMRTYNTTNSAMHALEL
jgi:hypothetical protein